MNVKVRIGVVGCGSFGTKHISNLKEAGYLAGVMDVAPARAAKVATDHGSQAFEDLNSLLNAVDGVVIATPAQFHADPALTALAAGKAVLTEKPICLTLEEATRLVEAAENASVPLMVGHVLLYHTAIDYMINAAKGGAIGRLLYSMHERLNFGRARTVEDALWSLGVHDAAIACGFEQGEVVDCRRIGGEFLGQGVEDTVQICATFATGFRSFIHSSWIFPTMRRHHTVVGTEGMLSLDENAGTVTLHRCRILEDLTQEHEGADVVFEGKCNPLRLEQEHFAACIRGEAEPRTHGRSALEVLKLLTLAGASCCYKQASG